MLDSTRHPWLVICNLQSYALLNKFPTFITIIITTIKKTAIKAPRGVNSVRVILINEIDFGRSH
jgi:hypothetical protein